MDTIWQFTERLGHIETRLSRLENRLLGAILGMAGWLTALLAVAVTVLLKYRETSARGCLPHRSPSAPSSSSKSGSCRPNRALACSR
jgi:hypothetical protein